MTTRAPFLMTMTALLLTACAMALNGTAAHEIPRPSPGQPFACALVAERRGGGTRLVARIEAREAVSSSYDLRVRGPGVSVDQGGSLSLAAGASAVLGEADVSSALSDLDARLTVTVEGRTTACPLRGT